MVILVRTARLALLALIGCGRDAPEPAPEPSDTRDAATATRWLECTESVRAPMEAALLTKYRLEKTDERVDGLRCVTIQLGAQAAFFVELIAADGDKHRRLIGAIAIDGTTEVVGLRDGRLEWARLRGGKVWFETLDLDGDHSDEVIVHHDDLRQDAASWIDVIALRGRALTEIVGPRISYADPDLDDDVCHGALSTERAGTATHLVVTTTVSTGKSDHCLARGRHVFALETDRLVEVPASTR